MALPTDPQPQSRNTPQTQTPRIDSEELLRGHTYLEILHQGALYRLQVTRTGKLLLTK